MFFLNRNPVQLNLLLSSYQLWRLGGAVTYTDVFVTNSRSQWLYAQVLYSTKNTQIHKCLSHIVVQNNRGRNK